MSASHQFVAASRLEKGGFELSVPVARGQNPFGNGTVIEGETGSKSSASRVGLRVRNRLPPAVSQVRTLIEHATQSHL